MTRNGKPTLEEAKIEEPCPKCGVWGFHKCVEDVEKKSDEVNQ